MYRCGVHSRCAQRHVFVGLVHVYCNGIMNAVCKVLRFSVCQRSRVSQAYNGSVPLYLRSFCIISFISYNTNMYNNMHVRSGGRCSLSLRWGSMESKGGLIGKRLTIAFVILSHLRSLAPVNCFFVCGVGGYQRQEDSRALLFTNMCCQCLRNSCKSTCVLQVAYCKHCFSRRRQLHLVLLVLAIIYLCIGVILVIKSYYLFGFGCSYMPSLILCAFFCIGWAVFAEQLSLVLLLISGEQYALRHCFALVTEPSVRASVAYILTSISH